MSIRFKKGIVFLVGAGPGDPGLMTLRGVELLRKADAIVYDSLVNPSMLEYASPLAERVYAGKHHDGDGDASTAQEKINRLLVKLARQGKKTVRLKGGDPFVFGRGGEEASFLKKAGIRFEVVPGVSAGSAVPAYAGIPVTDRRFASEVIFATAHESADKKEISRRWALLASMPGTLVLFMGVRTLAQITKELIKYGKPRKTPVAIIEKGTLPGQRVAEGTLENIAAKARAARIQAPALTVIGEVGRLRKNLQWFFPRGKQSGGGLAGKTVLLTRPHDRNGFLRRTLEDEGARVLEFPAIRIEPPRDWKPLDNALGNLRLFDWMVFTSVHGVEAVFSRLAAAGKDGRALANVKIAAVGESTAGALAQNGIKPDFIPEKFTSDSLVKGLDAKKMIGGKHFLLPRTDIAPEQFRKSLEARGALVTQVIAYRTVSGAGPREKKQLQAWVAKKKIDFVTFTSSSTVRHFFEALPAAASRSIKSHFISIGPVTSKTLKQYGHRPYREAKQHSITGILEVLTHGHA